MENLEHLEKLQIPALPNDPLIESTRQVIAEREEAIAHLRADIAQLDAEDGQDFIDLDSPRAVERRAQRLRLNAELQQATTSLEGAKDYLQRREEMFMYRSVRSLREQIEDDMRRASTLASEVGAGNEEIARKLKAMQDITRGIVTKLHGARGRSTLTKDGHIAHTAITEIADTETHHFWMMRHFTGMLGWRTEWGAGPDFDVAANGAFAQVGGSISTLLGDENFAPDIVSAVQAEDAMGTEVALVDQAGG